MTAIASNLSRPLFAVEDAFVSSACEHILVTRFKCIGDILYTLPAIHALRHYFPKARITYLTSKENASLLEGFSCVDEVLTVDRSVFRRPNLLPIARETFGLVRRLRQEKFSLTIDFQGYGETALLQWLTHAPKRWGFVYRSTRRWAYTRGIGRSRARSLHPVDRNLSLLGRCGLPPIAACNDFALPPAALAEAERLFAQWHLDEARPLLFVQPFTSARGRNWPLENYLALANHWRDSGAQVLFGGGPSEAAELEPARRAGFPVSAGVPLLLSAGLMKLSTVIVGGDTGLLHLAVAMGKRIVFLAGSGNRAYPFQHADWKVIPADGLGISAVRVDTVTGACARAFADCANQH